MSKSERQPQEDKNIKKKTQHEPQTESKPQEKNGGQNKMAVALKYNADKDAAPVVIASGYGPIAERIIDIAEQRGIPVYRDDSAASMLCMLGVGANIPEELYQVVAAIYSQILHVAAKLQKGETGAHGTSEQLLQQVTAEMVKNDGTVMAADEGATGE